MKNIKRYLSNLVYYNTWLYNSRDWDFSWLLQIILLWLKSFQTHTTNCVAGRKDTEIHLKETIALLEAIIKDEWAEEETKAHDKKWGKLWTTSKKIKNKDLYEVNFHRAHVKTNGDKKQERKEKLALYALENKRKQQTINRFFHLFKKYFQSWWC